MKDSELEMDTMNKLVTTPIVVLNRVKIYDCKDCLQGFLSQRDYALHLVQHTHNQVLNSKGRYYNKDYDYLKVNKCEECGLRFVLKSTLEAHQAVHAPYQHICHCGIGYYTSRDLHSHKKLVHKNENIDIKQDISNSTEDDASESHCKYLDVERKFNIAPKLKAGLVYKEKSKHRKKGKKGNRSNNARLKVYEDEDEDEDPNGDYVCPVCANKYNEKLKLLGHLSSHCNSIDLKCVLCNKKFSQMIAVKLHLMRTHSGIKDEKCSYCDKVFFSRCSVKLHERTHTGHRPYACKYCEKPFNDPSALRRHERIHEGDKRYKCQHCIKAFTDAGAALRHRLTHVNSGRIYECKKCDKKFTTIMYLKSHMKVHRFEKNYQCDLCSKWFATKPYLKIHIYTVHIKHNRYECDECGKKFHIKNRLTAHFEITHSNTYYHCGECGKKCKTNVGLWQHKKIVHGSRQFLCNDCPNQYTTKSELSRHVVNNHLNVKCEQCSSHFPSNTMLEKHKKKGCIKCIKCNKFFSNATLRNQHYQVAHSEKSVKREKCDICNKYYRLQTLSKHRAKFHSDVKEYQCDHCKQFFPMKETLRYHIMRQHMLALYCDKCHKPFYTESQFASHKKKVCLIKLYPCSICLREHTSLSGLKSHLVVHCDDFNYVCDICNDKFKREASLKRHFKLVHGIV